MPGRALQAARWGDTARSRPPESSQRPNNYQCTSHNRRIALTGVIGAAMALIARQAEATDYKEALAR